MRRTSILITALFAICPAALHALGPLMIDVNGNAEYLYSALSTQDSPFNPGNVLSVPGAAHLFEMKLNASVRKFYGEWRGRYESEPENASSHLDQAYLFFEDDDFFKYRIGRQRVGFGVGYLWNPVNDLDKRRDIYNPTKYTEGVNAALATLDFYERYKQPMALSVEVVLPDGTKRPSDAEYARFGAQFYTLHSDIEFGVAASFGSVEGFGNDALLGAYSSMDIGGAILGAEYAVSKKTSLPYFSRNAVFYKDDFNHQALVNLNRRLTEKTFLMLEYFYNGFGYGDEEFDNMIRLLESSFARYAPAAGTLAPGYVSKHYFFASVSREVSDFWTIALTSMASLDRSGGFLYPQFSYTGIDNVTLSLEAITNVYGSTENEFSSSLYRNALLARIQYFF